jgi:hypothetical protein
MLLIYGDSHAEASFRNLRLEHKNLYSYGVTMHRIGRDKVIPGHTSNIMRNANTFCFVYGEVDCRCHIGKQVLLGRDEDDVINELTSAYIDSIKSAITSYKQIIIVGVIPPRCQEEFEHDHGPITHEFPFVGTDDERVRYTNKVNKNLKSLCEMHGFQYFSEYDYCSRGDGCLEKRYSDGNCHLKDNAVFINKFLNILQ